MIRSFQPIYQKPPPTLRHGSDARQDGEQWSLDGWPYPELRWSPIWIEPDCLIRGIIDHKLIRLAERGDPFREAIEHLPHKTHGPLSSVKVDAKEFLDADDRATKIGLGTVRSVRMMPCGQKFFRQILSRASASCVSANSIS
jgi:hypothetical protein